MENAIYNESHVRQMLMMAYPAYRVNSITPWIQTFKENWDNRNDKNFTLLVGNFTIGFETQDSVIALMNNVLGITKFQYNWDVAQAAYPQPITLYTMADQLEVGAGSFATFIGWNCDMEPYVKPVDESGGFQVTFDIDGVPFTSANNLRTDSNNWYTQGFSYFVLNRSSTHFQAEMYLPAFTTTSFYDDYNVTHSASILLFNITSANYIAMSNTWQIIMEGDPNADGTVTFNKLTTSISSWDIQNDGASLGDLEGVQFNAVPVTFQSGSHFPLSPGLTQLAQSTTGTHTVTVQIAQAGTVSVTGSDGVNQAIYSAVAGFVDVTGVVVDAISPVLVLFQP